ncbi:50S ribosomal protein L22 [Buchnera aphidicola]|uniref:Large ribosomal subunit protein uL22 n=1 Tax=Buchnera aphidicola subsp. Tuberolachnus salignus TaxID=98804 RepID=A0A160SZC7_BUCTT|nr:50S ribosomal protein L22 [Buchnera aphidicola]CUR53316.1 50S ribosomal protein L22 [Buchnera aphidicola (Tuberolachnus salignus)]
MNVCAKSKKVRSSAQKMRLVVNIIRGKNALEALKILENINKKSSYLLKKLLKSALANAEHNYNHKISTLFISKIFVDSGPTMKRMLPRAKGRADRILKRTSHITMILSRFHRKQEISYGTKSTS